MAPEIPPAAGAYPRRPGNHVAPIVDGEPAFRRIARAVEAARASVWVTLAFVDRDARLPDGRGTVFDVLDAAAARGVDVRALVWHEPDLDTMLPGSWHFPGREGERSWLAARQSRLRVRWDHVPDFCHHQKTWLIDAGTPEEVAFVGGINVEHGFMVSPGHRPPRDGDNIHDVYLEVCGPSATDVHHNFVQRWNEASERGTTAGVWPDAASADDLPFPTVASAPRGDVPVQIVRTIRAGLYRADTPTPGGAAFPVADGETSARDQYLAAIAGARRSLYLEQQFLASPEVLLAMEEALERGVQVVVLMPGDPMQQVREARKDARYAPLFEHLGTLARFAHFTLAAPVVTGPNGAAQDVYVHAKVGLVDDAWATVGSTNIATRSFYGDTELNASFWHAATVRAFRCALLREHLDVDTAHLDDRAALRLYAETARANQKRRARGEPLQGLAVALDPKTYAA
jgi:phosphatidylserine/phosphatidylglycerophosphate/cardiolipin synthase-like enzyme